MNVVETLKYIGATKAGLSYLITSALSGTGPAYTILTSASIITSRGMKSGRTGELTNALSSILRQCYGTHKGLLLCKQSDILKEILDDSNSINDSERMENLLALSKTPLGLDLLREKGHVYSLTEFIFERLSLRC